MTIDQLIAMVRSSMAAKLEQRGKHTAEIEEVRSACLAAKADPTDDQAAKVTAARAAVTAIDAELETLKARETELLEEKRSDEAAATLARSVAPDQAQRAGATTITAEERTYTAEKNQRGEASFFVDAFRAEQMNDWRARERLDRHSREVSVEGEFSARDAGTQERATTTGSYAGLVIPQYLVDQAALIARAGRPVANACQGLPLPEQGMSVIIPRGTTGASATSQATENSAVSSTDEVWANLTVPVVTIAGQAPVSRQSLERGAPGIDSLIYSDLAGAYSAELDRQVVNGSGASNQMLGILQTAGVNQSTAFTAAATAATFYSKSAGGVNDVEENRFLAPTVIFMRPRRWNWLLSLVDASNRPLAVPVASGPNNATATYDGPEYGKVVGYFLGLPVITDANIPTNVGSGPEDVEIIARAEDLLLWEQGDGMPRELRFEQTLGNQLTTTLVSYGYAAFTAGRYPKAVSLVGGNSAAGFGLVAPTF